MSSSYGDEKPIMADETTPLVQVIQIRPAVPRYPHHTIRRVCTAVLAIVPLCVVVAFFLAVTLPGPFDGNDGAEWAVYFPWTATGISKAWPQTDGVTYEGLQNILISTPDPAKAREWSQYYTSGPHLAGKNLSQAIWTKEKWQEFGVSNTLIVDYDVYLNYPMGHRLALLEKDKKSKREERADTVSKESWSVKFEASLEEDVLKEDNTSGLSDRIPTFHGYSASGNVTAPYVFVNYGTYKDFEELQMANVSLAGKIALIKYGGIFRGLKIKRAQELGMVGAVIYSDPGDDGEVTKENGNTTYPKGPAREPSSVQRGSVEFLSKHLSAPAYI
jgi:N-acetylated-alpha-linked acidic dipeptidase